jgi:hypothetical protein
MLGNGTYKKTVFNVFVDFIELQGNPMSHIINSVMLLFLKSSIVVKGLYSCITCVRLALT